jgi:hypothetical protein
MRDPFEDDDERKLDMLTERDPTRYDISGGVPYGPENRPSGWVPEPDDLEPMPEPPPKRPNYGINTKVLEFLMDQHAPESAMNNKLMGAVAQGAAQMGTLGGKTADTSSVQKFGQQMDKETRARKDRLAKYLMGIQGQRDKQRSLEEADERRHKYRMKEIAARNNAKRRATRDADIRTRYVPDVGVALTKADAKTLKAAHIQKQKFDRQIKEMIGLREKHSGGAIFNREDVERGQQLSKDLLLTYKNLAKLGVLSQADEKIINAIIPADPLEYRAAGLLGQDPVSHRLKKFQEDSDAQYKAEVRARLDEAYQRPGGQTHEKPDAPGGKFPLPEGKPERRLITGGAHKGKIAVWDASVGKYVKED